MTKFAPCKFWLGLCLLWMALSVPFGAFSLPEPMSPPRLVNDFAGLLDDVQRQTLEQKLENFDRETSTQIAVVTVTDLEGYAPADYAQRLHEKWGIGQKGKDNGILILVKPSTVDSRGEAFISVGYGLEGVVPDITAGRILDVEMIPAFREGDIYAGVDRSVDVLMQLTRGEFTAEEYNGAQGPGAGALILFIVLLFMMLFFSSGRRSGGNDGHSGGGWIPPMIFRGGSGGGGSFGGFGGFGGGSSGGGGAGRSW